MAIFDKSDKMQKWKYHVAEIHLLIPGEKPVTIPAERLTKMIITEDFESLLFPLFKIQLVLESSLYYKILKNKNTCSIQLKIHKFYQNLDNSKKSIYKKFINDTFVLISDEATDDMLNALKEKENKTDYKTRKKSDQTKLEKVDNKISFYLFKSIVDGTKTNINKVLVNSNVTDAVAYIASMMKIKNILMAPTDNTKVYKELLIPLMSITKAFGFLDTYYGFYKDGSIIYFGLNYTYIIPYNGKCKAYVSGEKTETDIIIPKSSNDSHSTNLGVLYKGKTSKINYIVADYKTLNISNDSISNDYINANDIQSVDSYSGKSKTEYSKAISKGSNFVKTFENRTENEMLSSAYVAQARSKSTVISIVMQDYDYTFLQPNKKISFLFEDSAYTKKYKGNYIIANLVHTFTLEGKDFVLSSTGVFRREK